MNNELNNLSSFNLFLAYENIENEIIKLQQKKTILILSMYYDIIKNTVEKKSLDINSINFLVESDYDLGFLFSIHHNNEFIHFINEHKTLNSDFNFFMNNMNHFESLRLNIYNTLIQVNNLKGNLIDILESKDKFIKNFVSDEVFNFYLYSTLNENISINKNLSINTKI